jgi:G patch domain-containing protein 1
MDRAVRQEEAREFAQAARVFRPMSGAMAQRFTPSSAAPSDGSGAEKMVVSGDPAEEAARMGMFGAMTRAVREWAPTRLVCKRFGVRPPDTAVADGREAGAAARASASAAAGGAGGGEEESLVDRIVREAVAARMAVVPTGDDGGDDGGAEKAGREVDRERNQALEKERPGDAVFKAIFGSDEDSD